MKKSFTKIKYIGLGVILLSAAFAQAKQEPPKDIILMEIAKKTAIGAVPGQVLNEQLEKENGRWVYSFDVKTRNAKIHEVQVDARSGKLVSTKAESDDEAKEHEDEKNETD